MQRGAQILRCACIMHRGIICVVPKRTRPTHRSTPGWLGEIC